jgi:hypothetical protein
MKEDHFPTVGWHLAYRAAHSFDVGVTIHLRRYRNLDRPVLCRGFSAAFPGKHPKVHQVTVPGDGEDPRPHRARGNVRVPGSVKLEKGLLEQVFRSVSIPRE